MEKTGVSARTVELAASELPGFFDALPRLLTEDLTVKASGTLNERLYLHRFYGSGSIWIEGSGGCAFRKGFAINRCSASITLKNLEFSGKPETSGEIVSIQTARYVSLQHCTVTGSKSADSEGEVGVKVELCSFVSLSNCGITSCKAAALASGSSILTLYNDSGDGFSNNAAGPRTSHGGIILLSGQTPELLGGAAVFKSGGLIVKADGTLL